MTVHSQLINGSLEEKLTTLGIDGNSGDGNKDGRPIQQYWYDACIRVLEAKPDLEIVLALDRNKLDIGLEPLPNRLKLVDRSGYYNMDGNPEGDLDGNSYSSILKNLKGEEVMGEDSCSIDGVLSANNTGTLISKSLVLKRVEGYKGKLALLSQIPMPNMSVDPPLFLDLGANSDQSVEALISNTAIGIAYSKEILGKDEINIALLSNGEENTKGLPFMRDFNSFAESYFERREGVEYKGMRDYPLGDSDLDLVITDGFTGNIYLKQTEIVAKEFGAHIKEDLFALDKKIPFPYNKDTFFEVLDVISGKVSAFLRQKKLKSLKGRMDPSKLNGSLVPGLRKPVFKAHGGSDEEGMYHAILNSYDVLASGKFDRFNQTLVEEYTNLMSSYQRFQETVSTTN